MTSASGSQPPCGAAATGSNRPFRDLPLVKFTATYSKLFKILVFAATRPRKCAIPVQTGVVPFFPSSARSEPNADAPIPTERGKAMILSLNFSIVAKAQPSMRHIFFSSKISAFSNIGHKAHNMVVAKPWAKS
jgi:hypothetical protein